MPWNETDREKYAVIRQRYASDLWDEEFALVRPLLPARKSSGRRPTAPRAILNAPSYLIAQAARGAICRRTFRPSPPYKTARHVWRRRQAECRLGGDRAAAS